VNLGPSDNPRQIPFGASPAQARLSLARTAPSLGMTPRPVRGMAKATQARSWGTHPARLARGFAETGSLQPANRVYDPGDGGVRLCSPLDFAQSQSGVAEP
jgi:hypothetical protein